MELKLQLFGTPLILHKTSSVGSQFIIEQRIDTQIHTNILTGYYGRCSLIDGQCIFMHQDFGETDSTTGNGNQRDKS